MRADGRDHPPGRCRHCRRRLIARPRRLCKPCWLDPAVRALYPAMPAKASGRLGCLRPKTKRPNHEVTA